MPPKQPKKAPKKGTGLGPKRNSKKNKAAAKVDGQTPTRSSSGSVWKSPGANEAQMLTTACPKIIIAGAPASGKGTQCEIIKARYDVVHLSTGDMLRAAVAAGSEVGKKAKAQMEAGEVRTLRGARHIHTQYHPRPILICRFAPRLVLHPAPRSLSAAKLSSES